MTKVIGLTGGIASGKSTVSNMLRDRNIPIIDADLISRQIVEPGSPTLHEISKAFGCDVLKEDGTLDRKKLGNIVFSDKCKLEKLNEITHKRIGEEFVKRIEELKKDNKLIIVDAPLLIEAKMMDLVDEIWLVVVDEQVQIDRLMKRNNLSKEDAIKRIKSQMSLEEKKKYAHIIIDNNKNIHHLKEQVEYILKNVIGGLN
ncbi:dephospho-CoA kinase [Anaeromicrobium sediminis]|uniref:Dephospho-CoA kinase n=2 Tax=Anaeromicrobium sediminis TaxID=1478221 RepID=A0A267MPB7_9FIRM|nr:dephospho-CoA kinase [Anaeromicrobium sediminis]